VRTYSPSFAYANLSTEKYPRFVVGIIFETESLYFTSHSDIPNVPGVVTHRVLTVRDARSQRIVPDEGRSEIGVVNFDLLDLDGVVTGLFRAKLAAGAGLRGKKVVLYHGWAGADFSTFQVFQTQIVQSDAYNRGVYNIRCADISREQRKEIFDPKSTRLAASIDADDTTIAVVNTSAFQRVAHGTSFSDAPSSTVGYIRIQDEIIRYTGTSGGNQFTGCTRGVLNTRAVPHTVDLNTPQDQRTEVLEVIYLEMPVPKQILAILTGQLYGQTSEVLPDHWHLGIDPEWVRESDFTGIGLDLWDPSSDSTSFVARFTSLKKIDGKKFLETELYEMSGCYPLIYSDGTIGIRRMNRILWDAPYVGVLNPSNVRSWSALTHDMQSLANDYEVQWNFNADDKPTRFTRLIDGGSITLHGRATKKVKKFRGLYGSRHTDSTVRSLIASQRDRYAHPPALLTVDGMPHLNVLEVGDVVRVQLPLIRDYALSSTSIDRSMEIQGTRIDLRTGDVVLDLFGSTGVASTAPADWDGQGAPPDTVPMPDGFYDSVGTELGTVVDLTLVGDVHETDPGTFALEGHANATNAAATYYHLGDLTVSDDTVLELEENVQLRVMGHLTINGEIRGIASGKAGVADTAGYGTSTTGSAGFGSSRAMDGVAHTIGVRNLPPRFLSLTARTTVGLFNQVPTFDLQIVDGTPPTLQGLPQDLRGTSGGPGGKVVTTGGSGAVNVAGGTGGDGGAGFITISRGLSFGASGSVDLSGGDSAATSTYDTGWVGPVYSGAGAPGCPGAWLIVLDGQDLSLPDLSGGKFLAVTGASGAPRLNTMKTPSGGQGIAPWPTDPDDVPGEGYLDPATTHEQDMSNAAYRIQYLSSIADPLEDQPSAVPPPTDLAAEGVPNGILLTWSGPPLDLIDGTEVYMATTNDRSGATLVTELKSTSYLVSLAPSTTRYFWVRNRRTNLFSTWDPTSATGGVSGTST